MAREKVAKLRIRKSNHALNRTLSGDMGINIMLLIVGCVIAFVVAMLAMKWFVGFLTKYGFRAFGWYRIIIGAIILLMLATGHSLVMVD